MIHRCTFAFEVEVGMVCKVSHGVFIRRGKILHGQFTGLAPGEKNLQFANQMLNKMNNRDLCDTLECFFSNNLNLTETAEELGVHRNTIIYRLNQISKILGADPRIFEQAMSIKIALLIKKLFV